MPTSARAVLIQPRAPEMRRGWAVGGRLKVKSIGDGSLVLLER